MLSEHILDMDTPEERFAELVDAIKRSGRGGDALVELLPEQIPLYANRSTNATIRMRGYILAAFERTGLPGAALPYVLEELETGRDAYLVAGAARALRGLDQPTGDIIPFLFQAIENIKYVDDALTFESYKPQWPLPTYTTALQEIFTTFSWLGAQARSALSDLEALSNEQNDFSAAIKTEIKRTIERIRADEEPRSACCCAMPTSLTLAVESSHVKSRPTSVADIELEDQDGRMLRYGDFFSQTPSIIVFFYTRCTNPNKCSLTITKLARLQQAIREEQLVGQLKTAAITYDPEYDLPARLKAYGQNRGVLFSDSDRLLRTRTGFQTLQDYFDLSVNFTHSIVNRHRIELFILDDQGRVVVTFARLQWNIQDVLSQAKALTV
jgi:cytochrome oxidase Cu insertion factor (SCO1/SenC/PrrC family)